MAHYVVRFARNAGIVALFVVAAMLGILSGVLFAYAGDLPQISALDNYAPSTITRVYAADGQIDRRVRRRSGASSSATTTSRPHLRQAIIAAEDGDFDSHFGLSISRIAVTADPRHSSKRIDGHGRGPARRGRPARAR